MTSAGSSTPAVLLGLNGATQAGDKFNVMDDEREAKKYSYKAYAITTRAGR